METTRSALHRVGTLALVAAWSPGCFYIWPFEEIPANHDPVIQHSTPDEGEDFVLDLPQNKAFVVVTDEDPDDELGYIWSITNLGVQGTAEPFSWGSQLTLDADPTYDGRTLSVLVRDGAGGSDSRSWKMLVVWEGR